MDPTASRDGSSISATPPSPRSRPSPRASPTSRSPGSSSPALTPTALRELAARHGIRPKKSLGQHFLIEPNLARRIVDIAEIGPEDHVLEIGAGLGSLTLPLAATGAGVVAVETDRALLPALEEVVGTYPNVALVVADAARADLGTLLTGPGPWTLAANLPYNVAVPVIMRILESEPRVRRMLVMIQREVGERLAAGPGDEAFGAVSLRVSYRADATVLRRVSATVFWPRPNVDSVLVSLVRRPPPVQVSEEALWRVIGTAFGQRRKTMRGAVVRLGLERATAEALLSSCGVDPTSRPEQLGLEQFACLASGLLELERGAR